MLRGFAASPATQPAQLRVVASAVHGALRRPISASSPTRLIILPPSPMPSCRLLRDGPRAPHDTLFLHFAQCRYQPPAAAISLLSAMITRFHDAALWAVQGFSTMTMRFRPIAAKPFHRRIVAQDAHFCAQIIRHIKRAIIFSYYQRISRHASRLLFLPPHADYRAPISMPPRGRSPALHYHYFAILRRPIAFISFEPSPRRWASGSFSSGHAPRACAPLLTRKMLLAAAEDFSPALQLPRPLAQSIIYCLLRR